ncbi:MAG: hypothetical protein RL215_3003 [Planctomycetota bacterium]|jgi:hypothetical protein
METGTVDRTDDGQHDLSAVGMPGEHELVSEFPGFGKSIRGMAEEDSEIGCLIDCRRWRGAHPGSFTPGDEETETVQLNAELSTGDGFPAIFFERFSDLFVVVAPVVVTEYEPAGCDACEWPEDFDGFGK